MTDRRERGGQEALTMRALFTGCSIRRVDSRSPRPSLREGRATPDGRRGRRWHFAKRWPLWIVIAIAVLPSAAFGQIDEFPYEAVVQADDVHVRCGPGLKYYPTGKLRYGERVTVHRHDPGGWYMIAPPPGSFSWIAATNVHKLDATSGEVQSPADPGGQLAQTMIRVGSQLSDDCSLFSIALQSGDRVEIIGEKTLTLDRGPTLMYQIKPPQQEFRWVKGDFIVRGSAADLKPNGNDPFAEPVKATARAAGAPVLKETQTATLPRPSPLAEGAPIAPLSNDVDVLDQQLTENLSQDPALWRLEEFEERFRELLPLSDAVNASLIRQRLSSIAARKQAQADYLDFVRLTNETTQREEQLRSMQLGGIPAQPAAYPQVQLGTIQPIPDGGPTPASLTGPNGVRLQGPVPRSEPIPDYSSNTAPGGQVAPKFDGAGIIQRSGNPLGTVPPYVLIAPSGKLLAFVEPGPGMSLESYVGKSVGVIGQRGFDARLQADRIVVRKLQPVTLGQ